MKKNKTISLSKHFDEFISQSIGNGRYNSANDVIQAGLRLLEDEEDKRMALKKALKEGEESGFVQDFDPGILLNELHEKHGVK